MAIHTIEAELSVSTDRIVLTDFERGTAIPMPKLDW